MYNSKYQQALFHVFTGKKASGNPALVTLVDKLPTVEEHNKHVTLDATTWVYIAPQKDNIFAIRWFKNGKSIQRCGHGTLAAAAYLQQEKKQVTYTFQSNEEILRVVASKHKHFALTLPAFKIEITKQKPLPFVYQQLSQTNAADGYFIAKLADEEYIHQFELTNDIIKAIRKRVLIITARSKSLEYDISFRYFAPQYGNTEDSATGSAASILWPFWSKIIKKEPLRCYQASSEGGYMTLASHTLPPHDKSINVTGEVLGISLPSNNKH